MNSALGSFNLSEDNEIIDINADLDKKDVKRNIKDAQLVIQGLTCRKYNDIHNMFNNTNGKASKSNINIKNDVKEIEQEIIKLKEYSESEDGEQDIDEDKIDKDTYNQICLIVGLINQQNIIKLKNLLLAKQNESLSYFQINYFIKDGFFKIYNFLKDNTHINDQFSCFFTFKEVLNTIADIPLYLKVLTISREQLIDDENQFAQICNSIIEEQMKNKKKMKNRIINQKRRMKEIEKKKALGLHPSCFLKDNDNEKQDQEQSEYVGKKRLRDIEIENDDLYNSLGLKMNNEHQKRRNNFICAFEDNDSI